MDNLEFIENPYVSIPMTICKALPGEEDENGNYTFEVEASNENLDLQNQKILQSALLKSKEYFLSNGVISDDHQHKTRNPDGSVETNKDKIIGEPLSIRTDGKKTFVKGILYGAVKAAKPFITLLKAGSSRVKASVGGIMPKVKQNNDGSETVTSFMWNDLALTCSPVNWTVGSASFAKSMSTLDFCKALSAGCETDALQMKDGAALQDEDLEDKTKKIIDISDNFNQGEDEEDDLKKSDDEILNEVNICIKTGELKTRDDIENFLIERGFDKNKAKEQSFEIMGQGGQEMKKSNFSSAIDGLLKSLKDDETEEKKDSTNDIDDENEELDFSVEDEDKEDEDSTEDEDSDKDNEDDAEEDDLKKSNDFVDATDLIKSMAGQIDSLSKENEELKKSIQEIQDKMTDVTKSFTDYLKSPNARNTVMQKSISCSDSVRSKKPTLADFEILKSALVKSSKKGDITLEQVQFYNSEFQKSIKGAKMSPKVWNEICNIVNSNR